MFDTIVESAIFSELFGFVVADPATLESFHQRPIIGLNLFDRYTQTDEGDLVSRAGAAIPVLGVEAGYYSIVFRDQCAPSMLPAVTTSTSSGWILHVTSGSVVVGGIGYLTAWNPNHKALRRVSIPSGWYSVQIALGAAINADDFVLEFCLSRHDHKPDFTGDVSSLMVEEE